MNKDLELIQNKFLGSIDRMSDSFGLNGFVAKLYGYLYLNAKALSLDEIAEGLGVSKGNVSINIRELEKWGAVRKVWVRGSRKDYYEAEPDIKKVCLSKLKSALQKKITEISIMLDEADNMIKELKERPLNEKDKKTAKGYIERFKKIDDMKSLAVKSLKVLETLL